MYGSVIIIHHISKSIVRNPAARKETLEVGGSSNEKLLGRSGRDKEACGLGASGRPRCVNWGQAPAAGSGPEPRTAGLASGCVSDPHGCVEDVDIFNRERRRPGQRAAQSQASFCSQPSRVRAGRAKGAQCPLTSSSSPCFWDTRVNREL